MTPEQKRLADRIIKLFALANSTTFAAEAQSAREMAEELMRTHSISLGPGKPSQDTIEMRYYVPFAKGMRWEGIIANAIADLCSCNVYFNSDTLARYTLVGTIWNLDVLEYMLREVNRQRIAAWMNYKGKQGADSFNKFCYGFAKALEDKISDMISLTSLQTNAAKLRVWYETNVLHHEVGHSSLFFGRASSEAGLTAGGDASLHRGALSKAHLQIGKKP